MVYAAAVRCSSVAPADFGLEVGSPPSSGGGRPVPAVATTAACRPAATATATATIVVLQLPPGTLVSGDVVDLIAGTSQTGPTVVGASGHAQAGGDQSQAVAR